MNLSRNPTVWRVALASVVAAAVAAGVISPELGETIDGALGALLIAVTALLPVLGAIWSKARTAPVAAGTRGVTELKRGADGVYREPSEAAAHDIGQQALRRGDRDLP